MTFREGQIGSILGVRVIDRDSRVLGAQILAIHVLVTEVHGAKTFNAVSVLAVADMLIIRVLSCMFALGHPGLQMSIP